MNRRRFVFALGGLVLAGPTKAQKLARIGVLNSGNPEPFYGLLKDALRSYGYVEGRNVVLEFRSDGGKTAQLADLAAELVKLKVDVIVATPTPAVLAAKRATQHIPIVMAPAGDPVGTGLVASLSRPGGNVTGVGSATAEFAGKCVELIREAVPSAKLVAVLANAADAFSKPFLAHIEQAGRTTGIEIRTTMVQKSEDIPHAFEQIQKSGAAFVIVQPSLPRKLVIEQSLRYRVRTIAPSGAFTASGGLMSYSGNVEEAYRASAGYVDKILKGAKPADLPVQLPTKYDLIINLKTAKALNFSVPRGLLIRAETIE